MTPAVPTSWWQTSDPTWHAYNNYGGSSLYTGTPHYKAVYNRVQRIEFEHVLFTSETPNASMARGERVRPQLLSGVDTDDNGALITQHKDLHGSRA